MSEKKQKKKNDSEFADVPDSIREIAKERLNTTPTTYTDFSTKPTDVIIHELQVHQIELVMQADELRKTQSQLEDSRNKYLDLYEFAPVGYLTLTKKGLITELNLTAAVLLGVERDTVINLGFGKFIQADNIPDWEQFLIEVKKSKDKKNCEIELVRNDASGFFARLEGLKIQEIDDSPAIRITVSDITREFKAISALKESEKRYWRILTTAYEGIWMLDRNWHTTFVNPHLEKMLGYHSEEILGRPLDFFLFETDMEDHSYQRMKREKGVYARYERRFKKKDGSEIWTIISASPLLDNSGEFIGTVGMLTDITERRQTEEKMKTALLEKEILLSEINHRVKNNLAGIIGLIDLQISLLTDPVYISMLQDLETRIRSMYFAHELLFLTENISKIKLATYTENLVQYLFQVYGTRTKVDYEIDIRDVIVPIETAIPLGLVMNEIVTNALKYAFPETFSCVKIRGKPCKISLKLQRDGKDYILEIADNGIGIIEETGASLSHSVGLHLIRFIVEHQLQGSLEIDTMEGTMYTIRFQDTVVKERYCDE